MPDIGKIFLQSQKKYPHFCLFFGRKSCFTHSKRNYQAFKPINSRLEFSCGHFEKKIKSVA